MASASAVTPNNVIPPADTSSIVNKSAHEFSKADLDSLLSRRFFYAPAFEIYGGG
jgi:glycyl-tRNA synthetase